MSPGCLCSARVDPVLVSTAGAGGRLLYFVPEVRWMFYIPCYGEVSLGECVTMTIRRRGVCTSYPFASRLEDHCGFCSVCPCGERGSAAPHQGGVGPGASHLRYVEMSSLFCTFAASNGVEYDCPVAVLAFTGRAGSEGTWSLPERRRPGFLPTP